jgi:hypothetical protein
MSHLEIWFGIDLINKQCALTSEAKKGDLVRSKYSGYNI